MSISAELWESFQFISATSGAVATVGTAFQMAYFHKSKSPEIKAALQRWFDWVADWPYKYFSQAESAKFIELLDRYAGARLWSVKRWMFVAIAVALCVVTATLIGTLSILVQEPVEVALEWIPFGVLVLCFVAYVPVAAVSISLTRFVAWLVSQATLTRSMSVAALFALLLFHVVLFIYWSRVVYVLAMMSAALALSPIKLLDEGIRFKDLVATLRDGPWLADELSVSEVRARFGVVYDRGYASQYFVVVIKFLVDLVTNGIRIAFALVFLGSYLAPVAVQKPLLNAWSYFASSDKPLLGVVIGAAVAVLVTLWEAGYWLVRLVTYVLGSF